MAWLTARYPVSPESYNADAALALLRAEGLAGGAQADDLLAWVYPSREAAAIYARANLACWDRPSLGVVIDGNGLVVGVSDLRSPARPGDRPGPNGRPVPG
jgi:hypothetical protein